MISAPEAEWAQAFEINPITLVGGIAGGMAGGALPLNTLMNGSLIAGSQDGFDQAFAKFYPLPGASLIENAYAEYPQANQTIAANALIKMPLNVSLLMRVPATYFTGFGSKLSIMTALQATLANHCAQGGWFIVATPSFFWNDALLVNLEDVSGGETQQPQYQWKWTFRKPLIKGGGGGSGQPSALIQQMTNGAQTSGATSGIGLADPTNVGAPGSTLSQNAAASTGIPSSGIPMNNPASFG